MSLRHTSVLLLLFSFLAAGAQDFRQSNIDESKVPPYTLPDVLKMPDGKEVHTAAQWQHTQRPYVFHLFEENVYGKFPRVPVSMRSKVVSTDEHALNGTAIRKLVDIYFNNDTSAVIHLLMYLPRTHRPAPVFLGMNFFGNQCVSNDPAIPITEKYAINGPGIVNNHVTAASRGSQAERWQADTLLAHGFGLVTFFYGDVEEDYPEGWQQGFRTKLRTALKTTPEEWSAIGAWAWALSRVMDYLQTDPRVNARQVCLNGHSRLGKTALWAGAADPRFAIVISNESGEGGAALARRWYGETMPIINDHFPHWFNSQYKQYGTHINDMPVDQHMLLALIAPRPLYVASAEGDQWSDPKGEFLSAWHAGVVYKLFGEKAIASDQYPAMHQPVGDWVRYHVRAGKHDVTIYDWQQYIAFAERFFSRQGAKKQSRKD